MADDPGDITTIGDYRILREIGRGGMGVVYLAERLSLQRTVALKVLPAHLTLRAEVVRRFRQEASLAARLRHPGIVQIFDVGEANGAHFIAMEFVDGTPLDVVLERLEDFADRPGDLDGARIGAVVSPSAQAATQSSTWNRSYVTIACRMAIQIADALEHAHRSDVIHRDVKPANVLVRADGSVVLTDFGLARDEGLPSLTATGEFAGTPYYVSPEQALAKRDKIDQRTDVFSLGVTLYELLTLHRPFEGKTSQDVLGQIVSGDPPSPRRWNPFLPRELVTILTKALEKDPDRRYASAGAFASDLRALLEFKPIAAKPASTMSRILKLARRHRSATAAIVVGFVAAAGAFGWWWIQPGTLEITSSTEGATVFVDGRPLRDRTRAGHPVRVEVSPGVHRVRLEKRGATEDLVTEEQEVLVPRGTTKPLDRALMSLNGNVTLESVPSGARVKLVAADGREIALEQPTPVIGIVRSGRYNAVFELTGFPSKSQVVDVKPGGEGVNCRTVWETGDLLLQGSQDGVQVEVFRGDQTGGSHPVQAVTLPHAAPLRLPIGTYSLRARAADHDARDWDGRESVRVTTGRQTRAAIWLPPIERAVKASLGDGVSELMAADLDGDGRPEIVGIGRDGSVVCLKPTGQIRFQATVGGSGSKVLAADLDGDGRMAVIVGTWDGWIHAFARDGTERFSTHVNAHLEDVAAVDLDGEGRTEIITTSWPERGDHQGSVIALSADGSVRWRVDTAGQAVHLVTTIGDADGRPQIVVGTESRDGGEVEAFAADGTRRFGVATEGSVKCLVAADVDRDGRVDVVAGTEGGEVVALSPDGDRLFEARVDGAVAALLATSLGGERRPVVVVATAAAHIIVLTADGARQFEESVESPVEELLAVDLDHDGRPEIVARTSSGRIVALWADGWHSRDVKAEGHIVRFATVDLDGDGQPEIVAITNTGQVLALAAAGYRRFELKLDEELTAVAATDLDQDGHSELIVGTETGKIVTLSPSWRRRFGVKADGVVDQLVTGDLDGDGRSEIVFGTETGEVLALSADGARRFEQRVTGPVSALRIADLDGQPTVLVQSNRGDVVALAPDGSHRFDVAGAGSPAGLLVATTDASGKGSVIVTAAGTRVTVLGPDGAELGVAAAAAGIRGIATGDVDGDAATDIVFGTDDGDVVVIGIDGQIHAKTRVGRSVEAIGLGDLDADGRDDIVIASREWSDGLPTCRVSALSGDGSPRFELSIAGGPKLLSLTDLDGDGRMEVVVGTESQRFYMRSRRSIGGRVVVLSADGSKRVDRTIAEACDSFLAFDVDGDGRPEMVLPSGGILALGSDGSPRFSARGTVNAPLLSTDVDGDRRPEIVAGMLGGQVMVLSADGSPRFTSFMGADVMRLAAADLDGRPGSEIVSADRLGNVVAWQVPQRDPRAAWRREFFDGIDAAERGDEKRAEARFQHARLRWLPLDWGSLGWARIRLHRSTSPAANRMAAVIDEAIPPQWDERVSVVRDLLNLDRPADALAVVRDTLFGAKPSPDIRDSLWNLAWKQLMSGDELADGGEPHRDVTLALAEAAVEADGRSHAYVLQTLGLALEVAGRTIEARRTLEEALRRCSTVDAELHSLIESDLARVQAFASPQDPPASQSSPKKPERF